MTSDFVIVFQIQPFLDTVGSHTRWPVVHHCPCGLPDEPATLRPLQDAHRGAGVRGAGRVLCACPHEDLRPHADSCDCVETVVVVLCVLCMCCDCEEVMFVFLALDGSNN